MLMELAYRLAVEDSPFIEAIRKNVIVMITPALEVDGRDRMVDLYNYRKANAGKPAPGLIFWGKYVAHDNNRDGLGLALALTRNQMRTFLEYHPTVLHDLHESVPYLYTMTGTGPYNAWLDPLAIDEFQLLAYHEIEEMTKRGVPGVWTQALRRLGAELHALYRDRRKRDRPLLRNFWQQRRRHSRANSRAQRHKSRLISTQSAFSARELVDAQQHQHAAIGFAVCDELRCEQHRALPEQLLSKEQTLDR